MQKENVSAGKQPAGDIPDNEEEKKRSKEWVISWEEALKREREYRRKVMGASMKQPGDNTERTEVRYKTPAFRCGSFNAPPRNPNESWKFKEQPADDRDISDAVPMYNREATNKNSASSGTSEAPSKCADNSQRFKEVISDNRHISFPVPMCNRASVQGLSVTGDSSGRNREERYSEPAPKIIEVCNQQSSNARHHEMPSVQNSQQLLSPLRSQNHGSSQFNFDYLRSYKGKTKHHSRFKRSQFQRPRTRKAPTRHTLPKVLQNYHCHICGVNCLDPDNFRQHCEGKKHKSNMILSLQGGNKIPDNADIVWCRECNIPCMNKVSLEQHRLGKKHLARIAMLALTTTGASTSKGAPQRGFDENRKILELSLAKAGVNLNLSG